MKMPSTIERSCDTEPGSRHALFLDLVAEPQIIAGNGQGRKCSCHPHLFIIGIRRRLQKLPSPDLQSGLEDAAATASKKQKQQPQQQSA